MEPETHLRIPPTEENKQKATGIRSRFPDALVFLCAFIILAAGLTYLLPAGKYNRRPCEVGGRIVENDDRCPVIPGSYHPVEQKPISILGALLSVQKGMVAAASTIFFVLFVGGALGVIERTGALNYAIETIVLRFENNPFSVIPIGITVFTICGMTYGMFEEIIVFVPILIKLMSRLRFDALTGLSICCIAAIVGGVFSPFNPFNVVVAQEVAQLHIYSGQHFRLVVCLIATLVVIHHTWMHAKSVYASKVIEQRESNVYIFKEKNNKDKKGSPRRQFAVLLSLLLCFIILIIGTTKYKWRTDEMSTLFLVTGVLAGVIGGLGVNGTVYGFVRGVRGMVYGPLLIGFAQATSLILMDGQVIDTIVETAANKLMQFPNLATVLGMFFLHSILHLPVPSFSGHAVLALPILTPLSQLLGISPQVTVLAYQYGSGAFTLITPTEGTLFAVIAIAGIQYGKWVKFTAPLILKLFLLSIVAVSVAHLINLQ